MSTRGRGTAAVDRVPQIADRAWLPFVAVLYGAAFVALFQAAGLFEVRAGVSVWYPPAGLRLALLLLFGWRFSAVILAVELIIGSFQSTLGLSWVWGAEAGDVAARAVGFIVICSIPPLFYALAAWTAERLGLLDLGDDPVARMLWLCGLSVVAAALTALFTCVTLAVTEILPWSEVGAAAIAFAAGDLVGILSFTPVIYGIGQVGLAHSGRHSAAAATLPSLIGNTWTARGEDTEKVLIEGVFCFAVAGAVVVALGTQSGPWRWYALFPPIVWLALRFGLRGAVLAVLMVNTGAAIVVAAAGVPSQIEHVQVFMIALSVTALLMGVVVSQLQSAHADLGRRISERTRDLGEEVRRRQSAEAVEARERRRAETFLAIARTTIVALDTEFRITLINNEGCALLGHQREDLIGRGWLDVAVPEGERARVQRLLRHLMTRTGKAEKPFEGLVVTANGCQRQIDWRSSIVRGDDGTVEGLLLSGIDNTDRVAAEREARYLASHDPVTGLHNRHYLFDQFSRAIARATP